MSRRFFSPSRHYTIFFVPFHILYFNFHNQQPVHSAIPKCFYCHCSLGMEMNMWLFIISKIYMRFSSQKMRELCVEKILREEKSENIFICRKNHDKKG